MSNQKKIIEEIKELKKEINSNSLAIKRINQQANKDENKKVKKSEIHKWEHYYFLKVKGIIINNFITKHNELHSKVINVKNEIKNALEIIYENNDNQKLKEEMKLKIDSTLKNSLVNKIKETITDFEDYWNNWTMNKNIKFCSDTKILKINKFNNEYQKTLNLNLKILKLIKQQIIKNFSFKNFEISIAPHNQLNFENLKKETKKIINFIEEQRNLPKFNSNWILQLKIKKDNNFSNTKNKFKFNNFDEWKNGETDLKICNLSNNLKDNKKIKLWNKSYFPYLIELIENEQNKKIDEYYNFDVKNFTQKIKTIFENENENTIENIKAEITFKSYHLYEKTLELIKTLKINLTYLNFLDLSNCKQNQLKKIENMETYIYYIITNYLSNLKNILKEIERLNKNINNNFNSYPYYNHQIKYKLSHSLSYIENQPEIFQEVNFFKQKRNKQQKLKINNSNQKIIEKIKEWNKNKDILNICDFNSKETNTSLKPMISFLFSKTKKEIKIWKTDILGNFIFLIKDEYINKNVLPLKRKFINLKEKINNNFLTTKDIEFNEIQNLFANDFQNIFDNLNQFAIDNKEILKKWQNNVIIPDCYKEQINYLEKINHHIYEIFFYNMEQIKKLNTQLESYKNSISSNFANKNQDYKFEAPELKNFSLFIDSAIEEIEIIEKFEIIEENYFQFEELEAKSNKEKNLSPIYQKNLLKWHNNEELSICEIDDLNDQEVTRSSNENWEWDYYILNKQKREITNDFTEIEKNNEFNNSNKELESTSVVISFCLILVFLIFLIKKWIKS